MSRRKAVPARPYPYAQDTSDSGRLARIPGQRGRYRVHAFETNPCNGATWWLLYGPVGNQSAQWRHVRTVKLLRKEI